MPLRNFRRFLSKAFKQPLYASQVAIRRAKAYFSYYMGGGRASLPEAITLFLTHRCNLHCKMCGQWGESGVTKKQSSQYIREELSLEELKEIIDDIAVFRPNITLFGGEPLLHHYSLDIIRYIKKKGMHCLMITNGSMLENLAEELVDSGLDELNVSLDGKRDLHDEIRGMEGLFERITNGLKKVNKFKKKNNLKKPLINLQCTITKYNYKHLEQLLSVAKNVGVDSLTYHNLIFMGKDLIDKQKAYDDILCCSSSEWEGFVFEPQINPDELYAKITDILKERHPFSVDSYPNLSLKGLREYYNNNNPYMPSEYPARCLSPWITAYIFPDGEIRPCLNFNYSYSNVKIDKFTQLWNNDRAIKYRRMLKGKKIFPVCARCTELYRY